MKDQKFKAKNTFTLNFLLQAFTGQCKVQTADYCFQGQKTVVGLLLSPAHLHGENNSPQSVFYTDYGGRKTTIRQVQSPGCESY